MKNSKIGLRHVYVGPNDALSQNFMKLGLLVAEKNVKKPDKINTNINITYSQFANSYIK